MKVDSQHGSIGNDSFLHEYIDWKAGRKEDVQTQGSQGLMYTDWLAGHLAPLNVLQDLHLHGLHCENARDVVACAYGQVLVCHAIEVSSTSSPSLCAPKAQHLQAMQMETDVLCKPRA